MKIPKVILDGEDYRREIIIDEVGEDTLPESETTEARQIAASFELDEEHEGTKERTRYALLKLYEDKGYDIFKKTCGNMKGAELFSGEGKVFGQFKGEACEAYLYVTITEFIKKFNLNWKVYNSFFVKHATNTKHPKACTEVDMIIVSEEIIVIFEAKSYSGNIKVSDVCTVSSKKGPKDIYGQNSLHVHSILNQIMDFNLGTNKGICNAFFWYANGTIEDTRTTENKKKIPLITEDNLMAFLTALSKETSKNWKPKIFDRFEELSTKYTAEDHKAFLGYK